MNTENKGNRKEWVKNAAIIFLSIMLILTFFSNTIMNYSLPEVATAVIEPGSITAKIRGTGTLVSEDPYKVMIEESRVISSVAVKAGDSVEKDQILFYLEDKESEELKAAEEELLAEEQTLSDLILAFSNEILKGEITNQSYENIQKGNISSDNEYQARITKAKEKVEKAQGTVDSLTGQLSLAEMPAQSQVEKEAQLANARTQLEAAMADLSSKEAQLAEAQALNVSELMAAKQEAENKVRDAKEGDESGNQSSGSEGTGQDTSSEGKETMDIPAFDTAREKLQTAMNKITKYLQLSAAPGIKDFDEIKNITSYLAELKQLCEKAGNSKPEGSNIDTLNTDLKEAETAIRQFKNSYDRLAAATADYENASQKAETALKTSEKLPSLKTAVASAKKQVNEYQARVAALTGDIQQDTAGQGKQKADLLVAKVQAEEVLRKAEEEFTQLLTDISGELNLDNQNDLIQRQREKVAKKQKEVEQLVAKGVGAVITAPVSGVVTAVNVVAGDKTAPEMELAMMQPQGTGYTLSFSVTAEQAKKVSVGEKAEVQNSWFFTEVEATLAGIRPDPENTAEKKLLVFEVKGEVQAGQSLSLSVGQKSAEYDLLVPNSAVREDNQGKFILLVESKNSPLGNRYMAKRVDVEVLAADELKTAINAPVYSYEYVITTATQPVEAGKQIRLADTD